MPSVQTSFLLPYIQSNVRHPQYDTTCRKAHKLSVHANGIYPDDLIGERRPGESDQIQSYRRKIFVPKTKPVFTKVYNSLMKIPRSPDMVIMFDDTVTLTMPDDETLKYYIENNIPEWGSVMSWYWGIAFRQYLIDANAMVLTLPTNFDAPDNEYLRPVPMVFTSESIIDYKRDEYYVLRSSANIRYTVDNAYYNDGVKYYVLQNDVIQIFEYYPRKDSIVEVMNQPNILGYMPLRTMRGICVDQGEDYAIYESRIMGIVPMLDEALREYSDMQAEVVQHIHSTMWSLQPQQCKDCKGRGQIPKENSAPVRCPSCNGVGLAPVNPFEHLSLPAAKPGEPQTPTPPMGYVEKSTDIARLQQERINQHVYDALASINMEYLAEVPVAQSGVAKQVDREELFSMVYSIAMDSVRIITDVIYDINQWRYVGSIADIDKRNMLLPAIVVPERFDLLSSSVLVDELKSMNEAKLDPSIINATQIDFIEKRFANDPYVRDMVKLKLKLDPFAGVPDDALATRKAFGVITQMDMVINANISEFVNRAIMENPKFMELDTKDQQAVIQGYAQEKISQMQPAQMIEVNPNNA